MHDTLPDAVTIKLTANSHHFVKTRAKQLGCESPGEYIRHLISADEAKASDELNLLAEALQVKVIPENPENKR